MTGLDHYKNHKKIINTIKNLIFYLGSITDPDIINILTQLDPVSTSNDAGEGPQTLVFTPNQIACVCNVLMEKGDYERLTKFMLSLPNDKSLYQNEDVVRAQCVALFHINDFKGLYSTLENHSFSSEHHQFLQVIPHPDTILTGPSYLILHQ